MNEIFFDPTKTEAYRDKTKAIKTTYAVTVLCKTCNNPASRHLSKKVKGRWICQRCLKGKELRDEQASD